MAGCITNAEATSTEQAANAPAAQLVVEQADAPIKPEDYVFVDRLRLVKPYFFEFKCSVKRRWEGKPFIDMFAQEFPLLTHEYYQRAFHAGRLRLEQPNGWHGANAPPLGLNTLLKDGMMIRHLIHRHEPPVLAGPVQVLHVGPEWVAVVKPACMPVHTVGQYRKNTVLGVLEAERPDLGTLYPTNRLDRPVSGVLVLARSPGAAARMKEVLRERTCDKTYVARVHGLFPATPDQLATAAPHAASDPHVSIATTPWTAQGSGAPVGSGGCGAGGSMAVEDAGPALGCSRETQPGCSAAMRGSDAPVQPTASVPAGAAAKAQGPAPGSVPCAEPLLEQPSGQTGGHVIVQVDVPLSYDARMNTASAVPLAPATSAPADASGEPAMSAHAPGEPPGRQQPEEGTAGTGGRKAKPARGGRDNPRTQGDKEARPSLTQFRLLHHCPVTGHSLVECRPLTGRTHQIRVHLQYLGFPIANDTQYGGQWGGPLAFMRVRKALERQRQEGHDGSDQAAPAATAGAGLAAAAQGAVEAGQQVDALGEKHAAQSGGVGGEPTCKRLRTDGAAPALAPTPLPDSSGASNSAQGLVSAYEPGVGGDAHLPAIAHAAGGGAAAPALPHPGACQGADEGAVAPGQGNQQSDKGTPQSDTDRTVSDLASKDPLIHEAIRGLNAELLQLYADQAFRVPEQDTEELCPHCPCLVPQGYPIDLQPLWLHAIRYSCNEWTFEAPLPDWANDLAPDIQLQLAASKEGQGRV